MLLQYSLYFVKCHMFVIGVPPAPKPKNRATDPQRRRDTELITLKVPMSVPIRYHVGP